MSNQLNMTALGRLMGLVTGFLICGCVSAESGYTGSLTELRAGFEDADAGPVLVVAHRGCWSAAPENSVAAMQACIDLGVEAVEIDVRLSKDGKPIVFHDGNLHRMTEEWGYVYEWTLEELRELTLVERDGGTSLLNQKRIRTNHRIATLEEILEACRGKLLINLEIKSDSASNFQRVFDAAVAVTKSMNMEDHVFWKIAPAGRSHNANRPADEIFNSVNTEGLPYVMPIVWESARGFEQQLADFEDVNLIGFEVVASNLDYWPLTEDGRILGADKFRYMGIAVLPQWSAGFADDLALSDPDGAWGRLLDLGFDMIMTDRPEQLISYLKQRELR